MALWICDVNGVLVDSCAAIHDTFVATAAHHHVPFTDQDWDLVKGLWLPEAYRVLLGTTATHAACDFHLHAIRERIREIPAYPAVPTVLAAARAAGIRIGVTTSYGEIAEACLVNTGLYSMIDVLVTQEEVREPKPHPESIFRIIELSAAATGDRAADEIVCVGDTRADIEAGKAAGVRTVGVTYGMSSAAEIAATQPDDIIDSFVEMLGLLNPGERGSYSRRVARPCQSTPPLRWNPCPSVERGRPADRG